MVAKLIIKDRHSKGWSTCQSRKGDRRDTGVSEDNKRTSLATVKNLYLKYQGVKCVKVGLKKIERF